MPQTGSKLVGVQYMRALASGMVLIGHVIAEAEHYFGTGLTAGLIPWTRGVDIFFVISGCIIMVSAQKYFGCAGGMRHFLRNRFVRVAPLYWFFTTLMLLALLALPGGAKDTVLDWGQVATSYLFIPYERYDGRIAPVLSLGWTLNYEIYFYALFSLAILLPQKTGPLVLVAAMAAVSLAGWAAAFDAAPLVIWSNPLILEFCFGVLLGHVYLHHWQGRTGCNGLALALLALGFALMTALNAVEGLHRTLSSGLPAALMTGSMVFLWHQPRTADRLSRLGLLLGDTSYALYLSHRFALRLLTLGLLPLLPAGTAGGWIFVFTACAAAVAASVLVHFRIEKPMLRWCTRRPQTVAA
ncbi:acyltransferase family protein [Leisingera thetidis]|uniref:acyltransferase family protein n=1 Tax=Leisingera thetidis TaxID=2930199 RepID=UPI0021F6C148|nr:acyltransferase [Leisingera thetidis]